MVEIKEHAIDQYIDRVMAGETNKKDGFLRYAAEVEIKKVVNNPDEIYHGRKDLSQVHIKDGAAVPVGVEKDIEGKLYPYNSMRDDLVVLTVYDSKVFEDKIDDDRKEKRA